MNDWSRFHFLAAALIAISLSACGGGGSGGGRDPGSSTTGSSTGSDTTGSTTGNGQGADGGTGSTSGGGSTGGSGTGTGSSSGGGGSDPGTGSGTGGGTDTGSGSSTVSVNLPFDCPADPNSFEGCWVSEICGSDVASYTSYRTVLWFNGGTLRPLRVAWGTASCPPLDAPSVIPDSYQPQFAFGSPVATTTQGLTGILLDLDGGKTKTVAADLSQLKVFPVQRLCFHVGHFDATQGIVPGSQRAETGPYTIDSTNCLQRHLKNP